ncbi:MAG: hypothetical protein R2731_00100 [Nocardioides sp.]
MDLRLSYGDFAALFGGRWGDRLQVTVFPECYLSTPEVEECATGALVPSVNNVSADTLTFSTADAAQAVAEQVSAEPSPRVGSASSTAPVSARVTQTALASSGGGSVYVVGRVGQLRRDAACPGG